MEQWIEQLNNPDARVDASATAWIATASGAQIRDLIEKTTSYAPFSRQALNIRLLKTTLERLPQWASAYKIKSEFRDADFPNDVAKLYSELAVLADVPRQNLLTILATLGGKKNLVFFCDLILNDPPSGNAAATTPFLPLFNETDSNVSERVFPQLLDGLSDPNLAPAILDLANFLTRSKRSASHPAASRGAQLIQLLDGLVTGLTNLQSDVEEQEQSADESYRRYSDSVALVVSLCDALALIGDPSAIEVLTRLFELKHRRVHVETAAALARLGDENGQKALAALAAEPAARLRALNYADELGRTDSIDPKFREPVAIAEAELVAHLAEPICMGIPPTSCALIDSRTLYWPGYEEPRICYLFRYTYRSVDAQGRARVYSNIGIAGPMVHTFRVDLGDRPTFDLLSAFAGWHAEHDEIYETDTGGLDRADQRVAESLQQQIENEGYEHVSPLRLGHFFGDKILIADAIKPSDATKMSGATKPTDDDAPTENAPPSATEGTAIADTLQIHWFPRRSPRGIDRDMAYAIYKGRRLLQAFND